MNDTPAPRKSGRAVVGAAIGMIMVAAAITGTLVVQTASSAASAMARPVSAAPTFNHAHHGDIPDAITEADGVLAESATVLEDVHPAIANLNPKLLDALRDAATDAARQGIEFHVNSGWRSPEYQDQLLREAVSEYGSEEEAARWVAPANTSAHVSGDAVDIGSVDATVWLAEFGSQHGLCQIYGNEPWHYELRAEAIDRGCPTLYADPTQDPRMQQ